MEEDSQCKEIKQGKVLGKAKEEKNVLLNKSQQIVEDISDAPDTSSQEVTVKQLA